MRYLDNASTTFIDSSTEEEIIRVLKENNANPSSLYYEGFKATKILGESREIVASRINCTPNEVVFTASGTEANNLAIFGSARARKNFGNEIVTTGYEHPSVYNSLKALTKEGFIVHEVKPSQEGHIDIKEIVSLVNSRTVLVSAMHINNEIGSIIDIIKLAELVKEKNKRTAFHTDMIQSFMKYPITLSKTKIDLATISAHKIHGPKGVGALFIRKGFNISPIIYGGNQEQGFRSGTENVAYINAFAKAAESFNTKETLFKVEQLSKTLLMKLKEVEGLVINSPKDASKYIMNFSIPGYMSETIVHLLDNNGIMVSAGAACSKGQDSHTLIAMGLPQKIVKSSIRVSFCKDNTLDDVFELIEVLKNLKNTLISQ